MVRLRSGCPVESGLGKILRVVGVAKPSQALEQTHLIGPKTTCKDESLHAETWRSCLSTRRNWHNSIACIPLSASWNIVFKVMIPSQWGQTLSKHLKFTCNPNCGYTVWIEFQSLEGNMKIHEHIPGCMGEGNRKKTRQSFLAVQYCWDPFSGVVMNMMNMETVNNWYLNDLFITICLLISLLSLHIITIISYHYWWWGGW